MSKFDLDAELGQQLTLGFDLDGELGILQKFDLDGELAAEIGRVAAWRVNADGGIVINDATFPIEVASYLWEGERAFFQASILTPKTRADKLVSEQWLKLVPEERARLLGLCPSDIVGALTDRVEDLTGELPQWTIHIITMDGSGYYKFNEEKREEMLTHSEAVLPEPCETNLGDPAFAKVWTTGPATQPEWLPFRPLTQISGMKGKKSMEGIFYFDTSQSSDE